VVEFTEHVIIEVKQTQQQLRGITCEHCGHPITDEEKTKRTSTGERHYVYYRCTYYNVGDHPRTRARLLTYG
jgi:hypothetical protein